MAFSFNGAGQGGRRGRRFSAAGTVSEINIVPLVDVVLVLLIIFMITANVMEFGLDIKVPEVKLSRDTTEPLPVINITRNGTLFLNSDPININQMPVVIRSRFHGATAAYIRADRQTTWDIVAAVVAELGQAKIECRMVTKPLDSRFGKK
jgi:biopolymer transport protein ExbD